MLVGGVGDRCGRRGVLRLHARSRRSAGGLAIFRGGRGLV